MYVLEVLQLGETRHVLLLAIQNVMHRPHGSLENERQIAEFFRADLVERFNMAAQHDDQPPPKPARVGVLDLPEPAYMNRRSRRNPSLTAV